MTKSAQPFLPYGLHDVDEDDIRAVTDILRGDWLTSGPLVGAFEEAIAKRVGAKHCITTSNGSTALHLAAVGGGLGQGQVAIVPSVTFQATASTVLQTGAEVVFADVDPHTALMGPDHLEEALKRAEQIFPDCTISYALPVHIAGRSTNMEALSEVAHHHGLKLIEDAAHAFGTSSAEAVVGAGAYSQATTFSFHPVKTITCGEGGAVTTNDDELAARMRRLRNHGVVREPHDFVELDQGFDQGEPNPWYYEISEPAFNYRLTDIQCALGLSQLRRLDDFMEHRKRLLQSYRACFSGFDGVQFAQADGTEGTSWHLAVSLIDFEAFGTSRGKVMRALAAAGIGSQVHYMPLYRHPWAKARYGEMSLPGAEAYYAQALSLPLHMRMDAGDVERVCGTLKDILMS